MHSHPNLLAAGSHQALPCSTWSLHCEAWCCNTRPVLPHSRVRYGWWESIVMLRKLAIALLVVFLHNVSSNGLQLLVSMRQHCGRRGWCHVVSTLTDKGLTVSQAFLSHGKVVPMIVKTNPLTTESSSPFGGSKRKTTVVLPWKSAGQH